MAKKTTRELRIRRHQRLRKTVNGTEERPRFNVFRSNMHIYAQIIDDIRGHTLVAASTTEKNFREGQNDRRKVEEAAEVGRIIAQRALDAGITKVAFDRGGYKYHGRVQALAAAARETGLDF